LFTKLGYTHTQIDTQTDRQYRVHNQPHMIITLISRDTVVLYEIST